MNMLHKVIYNVGAKFRNPQLMKRYTFLKETEKWTIEELEDYQLKEFKKIITIAYSKSPYYKKLYDQAKVKPADINTLEDLKKIPIVTKKDLLVNNKQIQNTLGYRKLFYAETSGSTGEPLEFYKHSEWDTNARATQLRGYSWYDVKPWEKNGYFWGFSFDFKKKTKTKILDFLLNRFRLFSYSDIEINNFENKLESATYLEGYSSMIYEVAKKINNSHKKKYNHLKMIKGTSEKIYDIYQEEVEKAFGKRMISEYGACETGIIAFECPYGNMHIAMEGVIVEEDNGEIVVTNLVSDSFPIIRYKLGDMIKIDKKTKCKCGMQHHILVDVMGRVGKLIYGKTQNYPSLILYYIFKNMVIKYKINLNYQAIQNEKGILIINIEQDISNDIKEKLKAECYMYFKDDMDISIEGNNLCRKYDGKFKDFISTIE